MLSLKSLPLLGLALATLTSAHFTVTLPAPLGSNIEGEDQSPCGGYTPSASDTISDFNVGGDAIGIVSTHAQVNVAYLGNLGTDLSSANWTLLLPIVQQSGLNSLCLTSVPVPLEWAGKAGILRVVQDAQDGVHHQCMHVNFVNGTGTPPSECRNSTGVSASFTSDPVLVSQAGASTAPNTTSSSTAATSTPSAAVSFARIDLLFLLMVVGLVTIIL